MPGFYYKAARIIDGEVVLGTLDAETRPQAIAQLQAQHLVPIRIEKIEDRKKSDNSDKRPGAGRGNWLGLKPVSLSEFNAFTQEFATLIHAGLPLDRVLALLISITENRKFRRVLEAVLEQLRSGVSLANALASQNGTFSPFYVSLVRAGEAGGALDRVLAHLANYLEHRRWLRDTLISALIYPVILACVSLGSILLLLTFVVPQFEQLFEGMDQLLPLSTRITITAGEWVRDYAWLGICGLGGILVFWRYRMQSPTFRYGWHRLLLRLPSAGDLIVKVETARFTRMLGILLANGVPLVKALAIVKDTLGNEVMKRGLAEVNDGLKEGQGLSEPLGTLGLFPPLAVHLMRVGEESGCLEEMLEKVAERYDRDIQATLKRLLSVLEPLLILVLGAMIAWVVISILVAMLSVNQLVF